ncbi:MAG: branched-chain amino acid ABC transporter permease [Deltaproteobacteria bacterium]|nr:branched-chain amino acid ABC transporter permease [Deltaproteobacteria bacterium]MBW2150460.1 branched-chain amino acid ABC transporter permease [Deltaproteobacteria bacterium]
MNPEDLFGPKIIYRRLLGLGIFSVVVLLLPLVFQHDYHLELLFLCHYYVILACSWDLLTGFTGNVNFGHAFFIGGAGFTGALLNIHLGWTYWLTIPIGGLVAAFCGLVVGSFTLRLKGPYFAAVTFCFATLLYKWIMIRFDIFGGEEGLPGIDWLMETALGNYYFSGIFMLAVVFFLYFFSKSPFGLILRSIGENETTSEGSGINTTFYKIVAFVISACIAGMAGAMYGHAQMHVGPEMAHDSLSILVLMMAVVGGMGSIIGPIIGAYLLTLANESLRFMGEFRLLIYSSAVVLIVLFAPKGLLDIITRGLHRVSGQQRS